MLTSISHLILKIQADPGPAGARRLKELEDRIAGARSKTAQLGGASKELAGQIRFQNRAIARSAAIYRDFGNQIATIGGRIADLKKQLGRGKELFGGPKALTSQEKNAIRGQIQDLEKTRAILTKFRQGTKQLNDEQKAGLTVLRQEQAAYQRLLAHQNSQQKIWANERAQIAKKEIAATKALTQLENTRQRLFNEAIRLQKQYVRQPVEQRQFYQLAQQLARVNVESAYGQKRLAVLDRQLKQLANTTALAQAATGTFGRAWDKFRMIFQRVRDALLSFVIIAAVQRVVFGFFKSLISSNQELETLYARLKALIPVQQEIADTWKYLKELTITTPFRIKDFVEASALVKAFGVDIKTNMGVIADWAAALGKDLKDTALAFGKIVSYSPRTALLLSTRGFSTAALDAYVSRFGDRTVALNNLIQDTFGGTAKQISLTFEGILSNIDDLWQFIARALGQPLFQGLKQDVQLLYRAMDRLEKSGAETLNTFGEIISLSVRGTGIALIGTAITLVTHQVWKLIIAIRTASAATQLWIKQFAFGATVTAVSYIAFSVWELYEAYDRLATVQREIANLPNDAHRERITLLDEESQLLKQVNSWWNQLITYMFPSVDILKRVEELGGGGAGWDAYFREQEQQSEKSAKKRMEDELAINEKKRTILMLNAQKDVLRDIEIIKEVEETGSGVFLKEMANRLRAITREAKLALESEFNKVWFKKEDVYKSFFQGKLYSEEELKNIRAQNEAYATWLESISGGLDIQEARLRVEELIRQSVEDINTANSIDAATLAKRQEMVKDLLEILSKSLVEEKQLTRDLSNQIDDLVQKMAGLRVKFNELTLAESGRQIADIRRVKAEIDEAFGHTTTLSELRKFMNSEEWKKVKSVTEEELTLEPSIKFDLSKYDQQLVSLAKSAAKKWLIPEEIFLRQIWTESRFKPFAKSPVGALGLGQLMPDTARDLGLEVNEVIDERLDAAKNLEAAARYLAQMYKMFDNNWMLALAAYNAGPGNVQKYGGVPPFKETLNYVAQILGQIPENQREAMRIPKQQELGKSLLANFKRRADLMETIVQYVDKQISLETKLDDLEQRRVEKAEDLANATADYNRALIEANVEFGFIDSKKLADAYIQSLEEIRLKNVELQRLIKDKQALIGYSPDVVEEKQNQLDILDIERRILANKKDILSIMKQINALPSPDWGTAFWKAATELKLELEKMRDTIVNTLGSAMVTSFSDVFRELRTGEEREGLTADIEDLQMQLIEARNEKAAILGLEQQTLIIKDKEAEILAKINELENERANIIQNKLLSFLDQVVQKMEEMAAQWIVQQIFGAIAKSPWSLGEGTNVPVYGGATGVPSRNIANAPIERTVGMNVPSGGYAPTIAFYGPVYGTKEFDQRVDQAMKKLSNKRV